MLGRYRGMHDGNDRGHKSPLGEQVQAAWISDVEDVGM